MNFEFLWDKYAVLKAMISDFICHPTFPLFLLEMSGDARACPGDYEAQCKNILQIPLSIQDAPERICTQMHFTFMTSFKHTLESLF